MLEIFLVHNLFYSSSVYVLIIYNLFFREAQAFPNLLSVSIELLLQVCDDSDADVRLMAGEALNKIIKVYPSILCQVFV